jgi:predicted nucleic-acid-binding protein
MADRGVGRGIDTNVLVRYLVADDADQHRAASVLIEESCTPEAPGLVHPVVLCELVWVLRQAYKVPRPEIVAALRLILTAPTLRVLEAPAVEAAVDLFEQHTADFADAYLSVRYQEAGSALVTFDRKASRLPGVRYLQPGGTGADDA